MARRWQAEGAQYLHIVDLDGAFDGESRNLSAVRRILEVLDVPAELGGGIRDVGAVSRLLALGLDRVILGTVAVSNPEIVARTIERFGPERIVVGIDARDGKVAVRGWEEMSEIPAVELALQMKALGATRVVYTDVVRDGTLTGPNLDATKRMATETGLRVIAAGGVSSAEDICRAAALESSGVEGVIVGKALYEGKVDLREVLRAMNA